MTAYDRWLEEPYQRHYAAVEAREYLEEHTCPQCRVVQRQPVQTLCDECDANNEAATPFDEGNAHE